MNDLQPIIDKVFGDKGYLAQHLKGYTAHPGQIEYAHEVARTLVTGKQGHPSVALLEAETGTGKTLGYLIPLLAWAALHGRRVAVATASNQLQEQIAEPGGELELAIAAIATVTGKHLSSAVRFGMHNFISPKRARALLAIKQTEKANKEDPLLEAFHAWLAAQGSLLASHWLDRYERFPYLLDQAQIACRPGDDDQELADYQQHCDIAKQADVVVVSHALLLLSGARPAILGSERPISATVVDEADRLPNIAATLMNGQIPLERIPSLAMELIDHSSKQGNVTKWLSQIDTQAQSMASMLRAADPGEQNYHFFDQRTLAQQSTYTLAEAAQSLSDTIQSVINHHSIKEAPEAEESAAKLGTYAYHLSRFAKTIKKEASGHSIAMAYWSPVRRDPSLQVINPEPGKLYGAQVGRNKHLFATIITSATLGDGREESLSRFGRSLGIFDESHRISATKSFKVENFGHVEFVLAGYSDLPTRVIDGIAETNEHWLTHVTDMIKEAAVPGQRCMVLTLSMRDTVAISNLLSQTLAPRVIAHTKGVALRECLSRHQQHNEGILISASAWEGVNLPGMVDNLIITRLPFGAPGSAEQQALIQSLLKRGYTPEQAELITMLQSIQNSRRRFRQGFGRGIRRADDKVTVWIGDPRFPVPGDKSVIQRTGSGFRESLPHRFIVSPGVKPSPYERARVFGRESLAVPSENPW